MLFFILLKCLDYVFKLVTDGLLFYKQRTAFVEGNVHFFAFFAIKVIEEINHGIFRYSS